MKTPNALTVGAALTAVSLLAGCSGESTADEAVTAAEPGVTSIRSISPDGTAASIKLFNDRGQSYPTLLLYCVGQATLAGFDSTLRDITETSGGMCDDGIIANDELLPLIPKIPM